MRLKEILSDEHAAESDQTAESEELVLKLFLHSFKNHHASHQSNATM